MVLILYGKNGQCLIKLNMPFRWELKDFQELKTSSLLLDSLRSWLVHTGSGVVTTNMEQYDEVSVIQVVVFQKCSCKQLDLPGILEDVSPLIQIAASTTMVLSVTCNFRCSALPPLN